MNPCKILDLKGEKCEKLQEFLKVACQDQPQEPPELWKGRDLRKEWKDLYKRLTGG